MKARGSDIRVGRVLHEDADFITLEVAKNNQRELRVESGDRYLTLLFVHKSPSYADPNRIAAWLPWEAS